MLVAPAQDVFDAKSTLERKSPNLLESTRIASRGQQPPSDKTATLSAVAASDSSAALKGEAKASIMSDPAARASRDHQEYDEVAALRGFLSIMTVFPGPNAREWCDIHEASRVSKLDTTVA